MVTAKKHRLLLIEDNRADAVLFERSLKRAAPDIAVTTAATGASALATLKGNLKLPELLPQLIVADLGLTDVAGFDIIMRCKADERLRFIPIFLLSASSIPEEIRYAYDHFAACYIVKPTTSQGFDHLAESLNTWLQWMQLPDGTVPARRSDRLIVNR